MGYRWDTVNCICYCHIGCVISESKPTCRLSRNVVDASDHIEILCHVEYNSCCCMTPVFMTYHHLPATHNSDDTHHYSPGHVWYRRVIAASDIDDFAVLNCSMTFTPTDDCTVMPPEIPVKLEKPFYKFVWSSPAIHIVNSDGKFAVYTADVC